MSISIPLPKSMIQRARDFAGPPAAVRAAATVVLLRPQAHTFQAYGAGIFLMIE